MFVFESTEDQADRGTIFNQIEFGNKYCDLHQLGVPLLYKDDGISGTIPLQDRPAGKHLLDDAKAGKIKLLLIYKLDRLGRTARNILNAIYDLEQYGVQIRSMTEPFDTSSPAGRFALTILAGVADLDRSNILQRLWDGANVHAAKGEWLGGIVPFGYIVEDKLLKVNNSPIPGIDMSEADVIRLIYHLIADQGMSTIKVADYLNALNIPPSYTIHGRKTKRDGKRKETTAGIWRPARIRNMIVNTTYKGIHQYGKRSKKNRDIITRSVPAIVSEETWEKAQQVLKNNQLEAMRSAKRFYLLRGLIKCNLCGLNYSGTATSAGKGYYTCNGKITYRGPLQGKCRSKNIPQQWIEDMVWNDCMEFITCPDKALDELNKNMADQRQQNQDLGNEKDLLIKVVQDKDTEKQNILDLFRKKLIDAFDVEKQLQKIADEKAAIVGRMEILNSKLEAASSIEQRHNSAEEFLTELREKVANGNPPPEVKREIVKALVKEVLIKTINPEAPKPQAQVSISYSFCPVVVRTDRDSWPQ